MACRTFSQQIGSLSPSTSTARVELVATSSHELVQQLTACATKYIQGWLQQHELPPRLTVIQIEAALAVAGWDWEAGRFDDSLGDEGMVAAGSAVASALERIADDIGSEALSSRSIVRRASNGSQQDPQLTVPAKGMAGRSIPDDFVIDVNIEQADARFACPHMCVRMSSMHDRERMDL